MSLLLTVEHLSKSYGGIAAVDDVSFRLQAGEILALIGPNGAGKSTCFNMLNGQIEPDAGTIIIAEHRTERLSPEKIFRLGVARTFQVAAVFSSMTVRENVETVRSSLERRHGLFARPAPAASGQTAEAILAMVGLEAFGELPAASLAYGDVKRLELAMALAGDPRLLLMDEPTAGMAPAERTQMMALIARIAAERRIGVLFTEHDMDVVFAYAHRVMVLHHGRLIASGPPVDIRNDAEVQAVYLGDDPAMFEDRS